MSKIIRRHPEPKCQCDPDGDCLRLGRILNHREQLPKKVCIAGMKLSTKSWTRHVFTSNPYYNAQIAIPLDDSSYAVYQRSKPWPIPTGGKHEIHLVIRQWIEDVDDEGNRALAEQIRSNYSKILDKCVDETHGHLNSEIKPYNNDIGAYIDLIRRLILSESGLPPTPHTAAYILSLAYPEHPELQTHSLPTRGILVTSIVLCPMSPESAGKVPPGDQVLHQFTYYHPWVTDGLLRVASEVARKHSDFWRKQPGSNMLSGDLRQINGRRSNKDPLTKDIESLIAGNLDTATVFQNAYDRLEIEKNNSLTHEEKAKEKKRVQSRIGRRKKS